MILDKSELFCFGHEQFTYKVFGVLYQPDEATSKTQSLIIFWRVFHHKYLRLVFSYYVLLIVYSSLCFCSIIILTRISYETWLRWSVCYVRGMKKGKKDVLSSPECPISAAGTGPAPSELTAWTLISNGLYVPVLWTESGGDVTSVEFQCTLVPSTSRQDTLYRKPWPLCKCLSISCKDTQQYKMGLFKFAVHAWSEQTEVLTSQVMIRVFGSVDSLRTPVGFLSGTGGRTQGERHLKGIVWRMRSFVYLLRVSELCRCW